MTTTRLARLLSWPIRAPASGAARGRPGRWPGLPRAGNPASPSPAQLDAAPRSRGSGDPPGVRRLADALRLDPMRTTRSGPRASRSCISARATRPPRSSTSGPPKGPATSRLRAGDPRVRAVAGSAGSAVTAPEERGPPDPARARADGQVAGIPPAVAAGRAAPTAHAGRSGLPFGLDGGRRLCWWTPTAAAWRAGSTTRGATWMIRPAAADLRRLARGGRAARLLELGQWHSVTLECPDALRAGAADRRDRAPRRAATHHPCAGCAARRARRRRARGGGWSGSMTTDVEAC